MSYTSAHGKVNHHLVLYHHFTGEGATQSKTVGLLYLVHTYNQDEPTVRPARTGLQQPPYVLISREDIVLRYTTIHSLHSSYYQSCHLNEQLSATVEPDSQ